MDNGQWSPFSIFHFRRTPLTLRVLIVVIGMCALTASVQARGRRQPDPEDGFPDYNRVEMRKKLPDIPKETPKPPPTAAKPSASTAPTNTLPTIEPNQDDVPKPPPVAIPSHDASEPALPEDIMNTLLPQATGQNAAPPATPSK